MKDIILGKGFVGTSLSRFFKQTNTPHEIFSKKELDYTNKHTFKQYIQNNDNDIRTIINCSGYTGVPNVDACEDNKQLCFDYNVRYPLNVAQIGNEYGISVFHIGSGCIYSGHDKVYDEDDLPDFGFYSENSSYYSKCKHLFEELVKETDICYVLRIRIPFTPDMSSKNYFSKLLKYDTLINEQNSVTSLEDFNHFLLRFIMKSEEPGVYNVVNPEPVKADQVVELLKKYGLENPNWKFINVEELNTKAKRSNCVLSTTKIEQMGLALPNTLQSLERDIRYLSQQCKDR